MGVANDQNCTDVADDVDVRPPASLEEVKQAIQELRWPDLSQLMTWFDHYFQDAWDRQMEEDIQAGKFDRLAEQALDDLKNGRCTPL